MSDVEKWIEQWHARVAGSELLGGSDVSELESHLREEMEHLKTSGLSDGEAFLIARRRLGDTATLEAEFAKVHPHRWLAHRLSWAIMGVLLYVAATTFANMASALSLKLGIMAGLRQIDLAVAVGIAKAVALAGAFVLALRVYARLSRSTAARQTRSWRATPILVAVALAAGTLAFEGAWLLLNHITWRSANVKDYRQIAYAADWAILVSWIGAPILLAGLFAALYLRGRQQAQFQ